MSTTTTAAQSLPSSAMQSILQASCGEEWQQFLLESLKSISAPLAVKMLSQIDLGAETADPFNLLEQGCGMGVVAPLLNETVPKEILERSSVLCGDFSGPLIDVVKRRIEKEGWINTRAEVVDAQDSGLPAESFTHVVSNIMYHLVPDSQAALKDSIGLLRPGGVLAFTTWHSQSGGWIPDIRSAFDALPPDLLPEDYTFHIPMQMTSYGHWDDVNWIKQALISEGLENVKVDVLAHLSEVKGPEQFMKASAVMVEWAAKLTLRLSLEGDKEGEKVDEVKKRVKEHLVESYGEEGSWNLIWVSIIASGRKPS
ncbi:Aklanonic acid methyltransferase DnrC [Cytospora mali]|uniref:Aklanonic acid methyltransferase DnrC n=1 Tax=Cytospora mali TaxID=578113 RepID=A0A194V327_CYTMA|nr:Aklanonic acid methyltransferase DnrC [Valsa mali var. pyri (nom. inval.)]